MANDKQEVHDCGKYCDSLRETIDRQRSSLDHSVLVRGAQQQKINEATNLLRQCRALLKCTSGDDEQDSLFTAISTFLER